MAGNRPARADVTTGVVLFVLAVAVIHGAWTMDRLELRQIHPSSAPGLTPGLLGLALAVTSLLLIAAAVRGPKRSGQVGISAAETDTSVPADPGTANRLIASGALCLIYALGLVGRMPFWLATSLFVMTFIAAFEWERDLEPRDRLRRLGWALFLGIATGLVVSYTFSNVFLVRLP